MKIWTAKNIFRLILMLRYIIKWDEFYKGFLRQASKQFPILSLPERVEQLQ